MHLRQKNSKAWLSFVLTGCGLVSVLGLAQTADNSAQQQQQPSQQQPAGNSRAAAIRQMIQAEAARRAAAQQGAESGSAQGQPPTPAPTQAPAQPVTPVSATPQAQISPVAPAAVAPVAAQVSVQKADANLGHQPDAATSIPVGTATEGTTSLAAATIKNVKVVHEKTGYAVEIVTSRPVPPALQTQPGAPPRLVIDLPNTNVGEKQQKNAYLKGDQFTGMRVEQLQASPPVARISIDLVEAHPYTWDAAGNRVTVRLRPPDEPKAKVEPPREPVTVPTFGAGTQAPVVPVTPHLAGAAVLAGSRIGSGATVTASMETAVLHIARGGELHVCPGSTVSVTASKQSQELMFGMSTGTLETHYHLESGSDAVLTPDFRILLAGPGDFDYAISANSHGDTCIRALLGNTASLLVSELMSNRTYRVKPTEQLVFHEGRIDRVSNDVPFDCGCAAPPPPVMRAAAPPAAGPAPAAEATLPQNVHLPSSTAPTSTRAALDPMLPPLPSGSRPAIAANVPSQTSMASVNPESAPYPAAKPADIHVQIEAPLVFRGSEKARATTQTQTAANMPPANPAKQPRTDPTAPPPTATPPPMAAPAQDPQQAKEHRGFFGKVKHFFSGMFH